MPVFFCFDNRISTEIYMLIFLQFFLLFCLSLQDIKTKTVSTWLVGLTLVLSLIMIEKQALFLNITIIIGLAVLIVFITHYKRKSLWGLVDFILLSSIMLTLPTKSLPMLLISTGTSCFLIHMVTQDKKIYFLPALTLGLLITHIVTFW